MCHDVIAFREVVGCIGLGGGGGGVQWGGKRG